MYIGRPSLTRLAAYLRGFDLAAERLGGKEPDPFLPDFRDWIHRRFGSTELSWEDTILRASKDEGDALDSFWTLLDDFLAEQAVAAGPSSVAGRSAGLPGPDQPPRKMK